MDQNEEPRAAIVARIDQDRARLSEDLDELLEAIRQDLREWPDPEALASFVVDYVLPTLEENPRLVGMSFAVLMLRVATDDSTLRREPA